MALIAGASYSGRFSELTVILRTKPTTTGNIGRSYQAEQVAEAQQENTVQNVGPGVATYAPELAAIFGSEDL